MLAVTFVYLMLTQVICDSTEENVQSQLAKTRTRRRAVRLVFDKLMRLRRALNVLRSRADNVGGIGDTKIYTKAGGLNKAMGEFVFLLDANDVRQLNAKNGVYIKLGRIAEDTFVKLNSRDNSVNHLVLRLNYGRRARVNWTT